MNPSKFHANPSPITVKDRLAENRCPRCGQNVIVTSYWARHHSQFKCQKCGQRYYDDNSFEEIFFSNPFMDERVI